MRFSPSGEENRGRGWNGRTQEMLVPLKIYNKQHTFECRYIPLTTVTFCRPCFPVWEQQQKWFQSTGNGMSMAACQMNICWVNHCANLIRNWNVPCSLRKLNSPPIKERAMNFHHAKVPPGCPSHWLSNNNNNNSRPAARQSLISAVGSPESEFNPLSLLIVWWEVCCFYLCPNKTLCNEWKPLTTAFSMCTSS